MTKYTVQFTDGLQEKVLISDDDYESDDEKWEVLVKSSSRPDDVDDWWES